MTKFLVTIDTEEEGRWNGDYLREGNQVTNIDHVPRFQDLCDEYKIRPTYLIDSPVATDQRASRILREIQDDNRCEVGAHLHPWCTPPFDEEVGSKNSFMCNLPAELVQQKLEVLTEQIESAMGKRPATFRAGRYGIGIESIRALSKLGYVLDSSVVNYSSYANRGGPDFRETPTVPYRVGQASLAEVAQDDGLIWEVPVNVGFTRRNQDLAFRWHEAIKNSFLAKLRVVGMLDRTRLLKRVKFSPEQGDPKSLCSIAKIYQQLKRPCLVLMFHSSSLKAGLSPYTPDQAALEAFFACLRRVFDYCTGELGFQPLTLEEYATVLDGDARMRPAGG